VAWRHDSSVRLLGAPPFSNQAAHERNPCVDHGGPPRQRYTRTFRNLQLPASLPCAPEEVEATLTSDRIAELRAEVERAGLIRGILIYMLDSGERVVNIDTARTRWADEERPVPKRSRGRTAEG
jgi:hypothetical protein